MTKIEIRFHPAQSFFLYEPGQRIKPKQKEKVSSLLSAFEDKIVDLVGWKSISPWRSRMLPDGTMTWVKVLSSSEKKQLSKSTETAFCVNGPRDEYGRHMFSAMLVWTKGGKKRKRGQESKEKLVMDVNHLGWYCNDTGRFIPVNLKPHQ